MNILLILLIFKFDCIYCYNVPDEYKIHCKEDPFEDNLYISGASPGPGYYGNENSNNKFYIFFNDSVTEVDSFRSNNYPVISPDNPRNLTSSSLNMSKSDYKINHIKYSFSYNGYLFIFDSNDKFWLYDVDDQMGPGDDVNYFWHVVHGQEELLKVSSTPRLAKGPLIWVFLINDTEKAIRIFNGFHQKPIKKIIENNFKDNEMIIPEFLMPFKSKSQLALAFTTEDSLHVSKLVEIMDPNESDKFPFEEVRYHGFLSQTWIGCPQPFCYSTDMDDLIYEKDKKYFVIYRGRYKWEIVYDKFPIDLPKQDNAMDIINELTYIDAAVECIAGTKIVSLKIKDQNVFISNRTISMKEYFGLEGIIVDTVICFGEKIYLFSDHQFYVFNPSGSFKDYHMIKEPDTNDIIKKFPGMPERIDASVHDPANSNIIYFFKGNFYYKANLNTPNVKIEANFILDTDLFFNSKQCKQSDKYSKLLKKLKLLVPKEARSTQVASKEEKSSLLFYIILFVGCFVIVVFILCIFFWSQFKDEILRLTGIKKKRKHVMKAGLTIDADTAGSKLSEPESKHHFNDEISTIMEVDVNSGTDMKPDRPAQQEKLRKPKPKNPKPAAKKQPTKKK